MEDDICGDCNGTGKEDCFECDGDGNCRHCGEGACPECCGSGTLQCDSCDNDTDEDY